MTYGSVLTHVRDTAARRCYLLYSERGAQIKNCRSEAAALREQQDREYAESMERDRQLRENAERERRRKEEEERIRQIEETRREQEREEQNAIELSNILRREQEINETRRRLPPEPNDTTPSSEIALVRFQLPKGGKLSRKFNRTETIQVLSHDYGLDMFYRYFIIDYSRFSRYLLLRQSK